ncbi:MAG TPA: hypothetical protein VGG84_05555, partial [Gemmatimonadaceae bacterium]
MPLTRLARTATALSFGAAAACSSTTTPPSTVPAPIPAPPSPSPARPLPPVPAVNGPLAIRVVYPSANQVVTSKDSNFIFGSIGSGQAALTVNAIPARVYPNGAFIAFLANPPADAPRYDLVAVRGADTARATHPIRYPVKPLAAQPAPARPPVKPEALATSRADTIAALASRIDSLRGQVTREEPIGWVQLGQPSPADTDRVIIGRPLAGGTYKWFFLPGTVVPLLARGEGSARVRLDHDLDVYVDSADVRDVAPDSAAVPPRRVAGNLRVRGAPLGVDVVIPVGQRPPYFVEETDRAITLTLYGVRGNTDVINYAPTDSMVRTVEWTQETFDRLKITVNLRAAPYGYLVLFENNTLVLRLRGRPAIDERHPLAGLTIAVDPGHPPIGSTGPTGLWEPQATLPVGFALKRLLE